MAIQIVTFIGGGQMAQALAGGAIAAGVLTAEQLLFVEPSQTQQQHLRSRFAGCRVTDQLAQGVADAKRLVLSVKPHILKELAPELAGLLQPQHLLVSIAAGISLDKLQCLLGTKRVADGRRPHIPRGTGDSRVPKSAVAGLRQRAVAT